MNRDDVVRMAREAGAVFPGDGSYHRFEFDGTLERFATLVAAAEREAIAQSLDRQADLAGDSMDRAWAQEMAAAVRARGEQK